MKKSIIYCRKSFVVYFEKLEAVVAAQFLYFINQKKWRFSSSPTDYEASPIGLNEVGEE
ncbi:hypothetical protein P3K77_11905 [Bacillus cytotoxicus]